MSNINKTNPLLHKYPSSTNVRSGNFDKYKRKEGNARTDWWAGDSGSSSSSDSSHSDQGCKADWESHVNLQGELFYFEHQNKNNTDETSCPFSSSEDKPDNSINRENSPGILIRLIRRRSSRRSIRRKDDDENSRHSKNAGKISTNKKMSRQNEFMVQGKDVYEVRIMINPENIYLGRRAATLENLFGLITTNDNSRIIISGFCTNFSKCYEGKIKKGDCLEKIDGVHVTPDDVDCYLGTISAPNEVVLLLSSTVDETKEQRYSSKGLNKENDKEKDGISILYAKLDGLMEGGPPDQGIIYSYPSLRSTVCSVRGSFFTLHQLLPDVSSTHPISTTVKTGGKTFHVIYTHEEKEVLLLALPHSRYSLREAVRFSVDLVRCLCFTYQSLSRCFSMKSNKHFLDDFFSEVSKKIKTGMMLDDIGFVSEFEDLLPASNHLSLPKEAQMHIDDALNELEANDIGAFESERLYSVIGSSFYHKGYMICSHLSKEDLVDITALCRHSDLLNLCHEGVKELVFWKEVYPASCQRGTAPFSLAPYSLPYGRWFLLIVGQDHDMLAVLLESGGCTARIDGNPGPNILYVEEAQATLEHIQKIGIPKFTTKWIEASTRIEEQHPDSPNKLNSSDSGIFHTSDISRSTQSISSIKTVDSCSSNKFKSNHDKQPSTLFDPEENCIQVISNNVSPAGPVLGRRAERERAIETSSLSRKSESEISDDSDWTKDRKSCESHVFCMADFSKHLLNEDLMPSRLNPGTNNMLFHYVHLDTTEGILLSSIPSECSSLNISYILHNFRLYAHHIHNILMNTVSFKKLKVQEITSNIVNKSLVAIKEHGLLFESYNDCDDKGIPITYWVVGRLFFVPQPREIYVCYQDTCPQNMVEIAFRLGLTVLG